MRASQAREEICRIGQSLFARGLVHSGAVIGADGFGFAPAEGRWEKIEQLGAVTIGGGNVVREAVTRVRHAQPSATSHQVVRAVHWGQATGNFLGRIEVARHAQHTDAEQDFKGLILEKGASANARPELEIYADDVKCAHGAAIGQLDQAAAFYMASRGIDPQAAKALLVRAFVADALAQMPDNEALLDAALLALAGAKL